jgi:pimeloyl-ACP methyl ester carboxylesterase
MLRQPVPSQTQGGDDAIDAAVSWFEYIAGPTFDPDEFRVQARASIERNYRPDGVARQLAAILGSPDRTAALRALSLPAVVIHGMLDPLVRPSGGLATARAIRNSRLIMFNDMGHDLPSTRWAEIAGALRQNADRVGATVTTG